MIIDGLLLFDSNLALTSTQTSTNVIDLVNARDVGPGNSTALTVMSTVLFQSGGSSTLTITLQDSTDNSTYTTLAVSPAIAKANMTAGARLWGVTIPPLPAGRALGRYLRLNYTVGTADFTAGNLSAMIVLDDQLARAYPPGITISN